MMADTQKYQQDTQKHLIPPSIVKKKQRQQEIDSKSVSITQNNSQISLKSSLKSKLPSNSKKQSTQLSQKQLEQIGSLQSIKVQSQISESRNQLFESKQQDFMRKNSQLQIKPVQRNLGKSDSISIQLNKYNSTKYLEKKLSFLPRNQSAKSFKYMRQISPRKQQQQSYTQYYNQQKQKFQQIQQELQQSQYQQLMSREHIQEEDQQSIYFITQDIDNSQKFQKDKNEQNQPKYQNSEMDQSIQKLELKKVNLNKQLRPQTAQTNKAQSLLEQKIEVLQKNIGDQPSFKSQSLAKGVERVRFQKNRLINVDTPYDQLKKTKRSFNYNQHCRVLGSINKLIRPDSLEVQELERIGVKSAGKLENVLRKLCVIKPDQDTNLKQNVDLDLVYDKVMLEQMNQQYKLEKKKKNESKLMEYQKDYKYKITCYSIPEAKEENIQFQINNKNLRDFHKHQYNYETNPNNLEQRNKFKEQIKQQQIKTQNLDYEQQSLIWKDQYKKKKKLVKTQQSQYLQLYLKEQDEFMQKMKLGILTIDNLKNYLDNHDPIYNSEVLRKIVQRILPRKKKQRDGKKSKRSQLSEIDIKKNLNLQQQSLHLQQETQNAGQILVNTESSSDDSDSDSSVPYWYPQFKYELMQQQMELEKNQQQQQEDQNSGVKENQQENSFQKQDNSKKFNLNIPNSTEFGENDFGNFKNFEDF